MGIGTIDDDKLHGHFLHGYWNHRRR
uniref:Uncharacterized protein n=1 Tax=Arundo donax TaxID=35708 RepID=A0A0A8ZIS3_ARUDO